MNRYLQRLVTRGLGGAASGGLFPVVRSASPIAQEDQRLGMAGFEGLPLGPLASVDAATADPIAPAAGIPPAPTAPVVTVDTSGPGTLRRKSDSGTAGRAAPAVPLPAPRVAPAARVIGPINAPAASEGQSSNATSAGSPMGRAAIPASRTPGIAPAPPRTIGAEPSAPRSRRVTEAGFPRLEPSPRAIPPAQYAEPVLPAGESPVPDDRGPRVVIGRINVEVVSQPGPKPSAPVRSAPLTAASVSVIGPLTGRSRTNQRLSLRHR